jgi:Ca2+-binding EF-hand superfamily protein
MEKEELKSPTKKPRKSSSPNNLASKRSASPKASNRPSSPGSKKRSPADSKKSSPEPVPAQPVPAPPSLPPSAVPAPSSLLPPGSPDELCIWHHRPLTLYCEVREEPLCEECLNTQYKQGQGKIIPLDEAYRYRVASVYNTLSVHLFGRKEQLEAQARRVEFRIDELRRLKGGIERDMQKEFSDIFERLGSAFNEGSGVIQSDLTALNEDLESLKRIVESLEEADQDPVRFLAGFKGVKYELERAIAKPFRSDIKVKPSDLPRELEGIRMLSGRCLGLKQLIEAKNELIWKLLHDRVPTCKVPKEIEQELKAWEVLADRFTKELEKYNLQCEFCGVVLDDENANLTCPKNSSYTLSLIESTKYPAGYKGNSRHYFSKIPPPQARVLPPKEKYGDVDDKILQKISKIAREKKIDVEHSFAQFDILGNKFIAPTDFYYLMIEVFQLTGEEVTEMIFRYDPKRLGKVEYQHIIKEITAKLPPPFQVLRENAEKFLGMCKKKDRLTEGAIGLEQFKDVLRQIGLKSEEIEEALKIVTKNNKGKILYSEYHDKIM